MEKEKGNSLRITVIGFTTLVIAMGIGRFVFTPILPLMQNENLLTVSEGGWVASVHFLGYWIGATVASRLPLAPKLVLKASLVIIGLSTLLMGLTDLISLWLILRFLAGSLSAFCLVMVGGFYIEYLAKHGQVAMQGVVFSGVGGGIALSGLAALVIMQLGIGSSHSWIIFGAVILIAAAFLFLLIGDEIPGKKAMKSAELTAEKTPLNWRNIIAYGATGVGYVIPATYLPVMARTVINDPLIFGWSWPIFGGAAFVSTILAARLQRHFTNAAIWRISQLVLGTGLLLPLISGHVGMILLSGLCVGGTFMIITMMGMKEAHRLAPASDALRHIAAMTAAFAAGQMVGPLIASLLYQVNGTFTLSLVLTSSVLFGTAFLVRK
ncbi:YbfB/YjiJ family MFS transporter [Sneathiella sp.]|jgi:MFS family permease|uniref:YbfB/YjiJ family MFS transporter n=1 Tax=Sneathiella sp. TaxID=1964365 RepID=UPI0039E399B3